MLPEQSPSGQVRSPCEGWPLHAHHPSLVIVVVIIVVVVLVLVLLGHGASVAAGKAR